MTIQLCDANIWVALAIPDHVHHQEVRGWFDRIAEPESVLFCRATQQSFLRLLTRAAIFQPYDRVALTNAEAWTTYEALLLDDRIRIETKEPSSLHAFWREFSDRQTASPNLWMDAYLAAFARAADYQLVTTDGGFHQFKGLDVLIMGSSALA